ncbi:MAG: BamA/TamA family outer membrane protein [Psychromonas sp.]
MPTSTQCFFKKLVFKTIFLASFIAIPNLAIASEYLYKKVHVLEEKQRSWIVLPYVFSSDSMGLTVGAVGIFDGFIQPQMTIVATLFAGESLEVQDLGSNDPEEARTKGGVFAINGYQTSFSDRLFISGMGSYAYYPNQRLYLDGSNDSVKNIDTPPSNSPLQTQGYNNWFEADIRYVLPWGESRRNALPVVELNHGIPVNRSKYGGGSIFSTGQTVVGTEIFYTKWSADKFIEEPSLNTNGMRVYLEHDNTDYAKNPSRGYNILGKVSADFGLGNSTQSWNALELDYSHYFELDNFSWTRQNVIAVNAWTAYSPSWDSSEKLNENGLLDKNQTPMWEGARLGGWSRMRAYDSNRFNDKAAIYGAVEYRLIPILNPMRDQKWNPIAIDWFQTVLFVEAGRVAPEYNLGTLFSDVKYDVGFSLRALAANVPVRFEMAFGDEGSAMWVMLNQPF